MCGTSIMGKASIRQSVEVVTRRPEIRIWLITRPRTTKQRHGWLAWTQIRTWYSIFSTHHPQCAERPGMRYLYRSKTCKLCLKWGAAECFRSRGFRLSICERIEADSANGLLALPHRHGC